MAINFPNSPTTNQIYTTGGYSWQWNGSSWVGIGQAVAIGPTGPTGSSGSSGVTGPTGAQGPTGGGATSADYGLITGTVNSSTDYGSLV